MLILSDLQAFWIAGLLISEPSMELSEKSGNIQYPSSIQAIAETLISESSFSDTFEDAKFNNDQPFLLIPDVYILGTDLISQTENNIEFLRTKKFITLVSLRESINDTVINTFEKIYPLFPENNEQLDNLNHPFNKFLLNISEFAENSANVKKKICWDLITIVYAYGAAEFENVTPDSLMKSSKSFEEFQAFLKDKYLS